MKGLSVKQRIALKLLHQGFVSQATLGSMRSLINRGMVVDLGLYDRELKCKRYGATRYRVTARGRNELRIGGRV